MEQKPQSPQSPAPRRPRSWWRTIKAVAWSFFGVRRGAEFDDDVGQITPLQVIAVGLLAGILLVLLLIVLVRLAVTWV